MGRSAPSWCRLVWLMSNAGVWCSLVRSWCSLIRYGVSLLFAFVLVLLLFSVLTFVLALLLSFVLTLLLAFSVQPLSALVQTLFFLVQSRSVLEQALLSSVLPACRGRSAPSWCISMWVMSIAAIRCSLVRSGLLLHELVRGGHCWVWIQLFCDTMLVV